MALTPVAHLSVDALPIDVQFIGVPGAAKNAVVRTMTRAERSSFAQGNAFPVDPARPYVLTLEGLTYVPRFHWWDLLPTPQEWGDEYLLPPPPARSCIGVLAFGVGDSESFAALQKITLEQRFTAVVVLAVGEDLSATTPPRQVPAWDAFEWARKLGYRYLELSTNSFASIQRMFSVFVECAREFDEVAEAELELRTLPMLLKQSSNAENEVQRLMSVPNGESEVRQISPQLRDASSIYDILTVGISYVDLSTSIYLLAAWASMRRPYAIIAFMFTMTANFCLTLFFVYAYTARRSWWHKFKSFVVVLPFGMFVPLLILFYNRQIPLVLRLFTWCGWSIDPIPPQTKEDDPVYYHVLTMRRAHVGFCILALLVSLPVGVLNVVMISLDQYQAPSVVSFVISVIALLIKGPLLAYSLNRPTYVFGVLCHMLDIYSIFALVSWVTSFAVNQDGTAADITGIWIIKQILLIGFYFIGITLCYTVTVPLLIEFRNLRASLLKVLLSLALFVILICAFVPTVILLEGFKFLMIPMFIFRRVDNLHGRNELGYKRVFAFLTRAHFREKVYFLIRAVAKHERRFKKTIPSDSAAVIEYICSTPLQDFSLSTLRQFNGFTITGVYALLRWRLLAYLGAGHCCLRGYIRFVMGFMACFVTPLWFVSQLISFLYPFARLSTMSSTYESPLAALLTGAIFLLIGIICGLIGRVIHFRRAALYASILDLPFGQPQWMDRMESDFRAHRELESLRVAHITASLTQAPLPDLTVLPSLIVSIDRDGVLPPDALTPSTASIHRFELSRGGVPVLSAPASLAHVTAHASPAMTSGVTSAAGATSVTSGAGVNPTVAVSSTDALSPRADASIDPYNRRILVLNNN